MRIDRESQIALGTGAFMFGLLGLVVFAINECACMPEVKSVEAAAGYEAQQLACVDRYADRANIDACRSKVKAAWAKGCADAGCPDAGAKDGAL